MAKRISKKKRQLADNKLLLLLAISVLVLLVFFVSRNPNLINKVTQKTTPAPTGTQYPIDTESDGVYINNEYGFRFKYPTVIFKSRENFDAPSGLKVILREKDGGMGGYDLTLYVLSKKEYIKEYLENHALPINVPKYNQEYFDEKGYYSSPVTNTIRIKNIISQGIVGHILYHPYTGAQDVEFSYGHTVEWLKGETLIKIGISESNDVRKDERLRILETIVDSMTFFNPGN